MLMVQQAIVARCLLLVALAPCNSSTPAPEGVARDRAGDGLTAEAGGDPDDDDDGLLSGSGAQVRIGGGWWWSLLLFGGVMGCCRR